MDKQEIKEYIASRVTEGISLSRIQDELKEKGVKMTFMELRLIASEIESGVFKAGEKAAEPAPDKKQDEQTSEQSGTEEEEAFGPGEEEEAGAPFPPESDEAPADAGDGKVGKLRGKTTVTLSRIQRPGFMASGSVTFGSGASGEWVLDQMGRLGFEKMEGKPDQQDIQEFQMELRKAFGA